MPVIRSHSVYDDITIILILLRKDVRRNLPVIRSYFKIRFYYDCLQVNYGQKTMKTRSRGQ